MDQARFSIVGAGFPLDGRQQELIELAGRLGRERFAPRAARYDAEASFPFDNFADLREAGLLAPTAGGNTIRMLPPLIATKADLDRATAIIRAVLTAQK